MLSSIAFSLAKYVAAAVYWISFPMITLQRCTLATGVHVIVNLSIIDARLIFI